MVRAAAFALAALPLAAAFPAVMQMDARRETERNNLHRRYVTPPTRQPATNTGRKNTGIGHPDPVFNAEDQYVDVTEGSGHEFQSPSSSDERGECPGLNAAANHGFLPRNGIATILQTVTGLGEAYNMSPELAAVLAAIAVALSGDPVAETWSIGGAYPGTLGLTQPGGIESIHTKYEADASIIRSDAYVAEGRVNHFSDRSWEKLMSVGDNGYTLDIINGHNDYVQQWSIYNNPYYFTGFFAGIVTPAAHNFVINFMSNHTEENPGGYLNRDILKSFFSVTGDGPYTHNYNQERIPENWYRRPSTSQYNLADVFLDVISGNTVYPGLIRFGGNTGTTNSFTGVDTGDLTGGVVNAETLLEGNNLACFVLQATQANEPNLVNDALTLLGNTINPVLSNLGCTQLARFNQTATAKYPGASYKGTGNSK